MRKDIMIMMVFLLVCSFSLVGCEEKKEPTADVAANKQGQGGQSKAKKGESKYLKDFGIFEEAEKEFRKEQKL